MRAACFSTHPAPDRQSIRWEILPQMGHAVRCGDWKSLQAAEIRAAFLFGHLLGEFAKGSSDKKRVSATNSFWWRITVQIKTWMTHIKLEKILPCVKVFRVFGFFQSLRNNNVLNFLQCMHEAFACCTVCPLYKQKSYEHALVFFVAFILLV